MLDGCLLFSGHIIVVHTTDTLAMSVVWSATLVTSSTNYTNSSSGSSGLSSEVGTPLYKRGLRTREKEKASHCSMRWTISARYAEGVMIFVPMRADGITFLESLAEMEDWKRGISCSTAV